MICEKENEIDEQLYSRQLYVFGYEGQRRMATSSVLFVGLNGLGIEAAKNVILAGVKSVTLYDNTPTTLVDLSAQFYLTEKDLGTPRAQASVSKLAELNPYVDISIITDALSPEILSQFQIVVLVDQNLATQSQIADYCHGAGVAVIVADTRGVFAQIFCDFGENFVVNDVDGEQPALVMIASITKDERALVTVLEETRHNLQTGDKVILNDIVGLEALNGREFVVTVKDSYSFEIEEDTRNAGAGYVRGGYVHLQKQQCVLNFKKFSDTLSAPGNIIINEMKTHLAKALHAGWRALHLFVDAHGQLPEPGNTTDAQELFDVARNLYPDEASVTENEVLIKRLALCSRGQLSPVCALIGGILGQEVLKCCSGKFMPINQWFYFEATEALSPEPLPAAEVAPLGNRYDGQVVVFGRSLQRSLATLNMFLVGAGAIGCEMLKNWAMMGIATGQGEGASAGGVVFVTDMDQIERSNLSRQFLFRNSDVGTLKSVCAATAATKMNSSMRVRAYDHKVAPDTESFFNDDFFEALDVVCAALDNVEARLYLDQRCLFYHKPMLESGTLGTKGHTQVVVPSLTEHYGAARDPPEKSIPLCTLKSFPNQIEHTLQWAREWFEEGFKQTASDVNRYVASSDFESSLAAQQNMRLDTLQRVKNALTDERPASYEDCVLWARHRFEDLFVNKIKQLLFNLPLDKVTSSGALFWSGSKKPPAPLEFDAADPLHLDFITSVAHLRATSYHLPLPEDEDAVAIAATTAAIVAIPVFRPSETATVALTEEEAKVEEKKSGGSGSSDFDIDAQCAQILRSLPSREMIGENFHLQEVEFDKDTDAHMRVVAACANLRARNYKIPEADLHTARGVAGKIMPAIATTTALVSGLACLEIYKLLQKMPVDRYMNTFSNLAVPLFTSMEPQPPRSVTTKVKGKDWSWSQWDRIDVSDPSMTLVGLISYVEREFDAELSMLSSGVSILYSNFMNKKKVEERKNMTLKDIVQSVAKKEIPSTQKYLILEIIVTDLQTEDELELPYLRFRLF